jgi:hypothetical protein
VAAAGTLFARTHGQYEMTIHNPCLGEDDRTHQ